MKIVKTVSQDKIHFTGFLSEPSGDKKGIIVHVHGMGGDPYTNEWYSDFHTYYPENGYAFLCGQHRGTDSMTIFFQEPDQLPTYGNAFEKMEHCVNDIDAWIAYARGLGYKNIILSAHSFGPSKAIHYYNKKKAGDITALVLISPVDMYGLSLLDKNYENMLDEAKKLADQGRNEAILEQKIDGEYVMSTGSFLDMFTIKSDANIISATDRDHNWGEVNQVDIPTYLIGGTKDGALLLNGSAQDALDKIQSQLINSPKVDSVVYQDAQHSYEGFGKQIVQDVVTFLK